MKKAKITLTIIAVLAMVGGTLAFKALNFTRSAIVFGCTTTNVEGLTVTGCLKQIIIPHAVTTNDVNAQPVAASTTKIITDCWDDPSLCSAYTTFNP